MSAVGIVGESIKSAIGFELMEAFPGIIWYKEQITNLRFPHFFVHQLTLESAEERRNFWWLRYFIVIRYRVAAEPTRESQLQEKLDEVGLKMLCDLQKIRLDGESNRITNMRYEKVDGVLHYFCNVVMQVTKERMAQIKMEQLEPTQFGIREGI